jgi:hypothetical protein
MKANPVSLRCSLRSGFAIAMAGAVVVPPLTLATAAIAQSPESPSAPPSAPGTAESSQGPMFYCKPVLDPTSGQKIPATVVWVPERQGNVRLIGWKSEYFLRAGFDPQKRCEEVTQNFQKRFEAGQLNFLTTGYLNGYPIVCGTVTDAESCTEDNVLFTLKPHDRPDDVLKRLTDVLGGKSSDLLVQNTGNKLYLPMIDALTKGVIGDRDRPPTSSAGTEKAPPNPYPLLPGEESTNTVMIDDRNSLQSPTGSLTNLAP